MSRRCRAPSPSARSLRRATPIYLQYILFNIVKLNNKNRTIKIELYMRLAFPLAPSTKGDVITTNHIRKTPKSLNRTIGYLPDFFFEILTVGSERRGHALIKLLLAAQHVRQLVFTHKLGQRQASVVLMRLLNTA
jgi:hypothetical protein